MKRMYTIWSGDPDFENWKEDLAENYPDKEEYELRDLMYEINAEYLEDERANLRVSLGAPIIRIDDNGRWNGRFNGCGLIESGMISDCLYSNLDIATWYVDELGDLRCDAVHHDGTNHYLYRVFKPNVTEEQVRNLQMKVCFGTATRQDITRYTSRLGDAIAHVYGWDGLPARGRGPIGHYAVRRC